MTRAKLQSHPFVHSVESLRDESGRSEGYAVHLKSGLSWDGCSFIRCQTIREAFTELANVKTKEPS
jgi:hypothetical protein